MASGLRRHREHWSCHPHHEAAMLQALGCISSKERSGEMTRERPNPQQLALLSTSVQATGLSNVPSTSLGSRPLDVVVLMQVVQTLVVVAGVVFAAKQLKGVRVNRQLAALTMMFRDFHEEAAYERRHRVLAGPAVDMEKLSDQEHLDRMQVADFYQRIGYLCRCGFLDREHVLEMYAYAIRMAWESLEPYVKKRRVQEGIQNYSVDFEMLALAAIAFVEA